MIVPLSIHSLLAAAPSSSVAHDRYFVCNVHRTASLLSDIGLDYSDCSRALLSNGNDPRAAMATVLLNRGMHRVSPVMSSMFRPIFNYLSPKCVPSVVSLPTAPRVAYSSVLSDGLDIPRSITHARTMPSAPYWESALNDELGSWHSNDTWYDGPIDMSMFDPS